MKQLDHYWRLKHSVHFDLAKAGKEMGLKREPRAHYFGRRESSAGV